MLLEAARKKEVLGWEKQPHLMKGAFFDQSCIWYVEEMRCIGRERRERERTNDYKGIFPCIHIPHTMCMHGSDDVSPSLTD